MRPGRPMLGAAAVAAVLAAGASAQEKITYADHVQPMLQPKCFNCHNSDRQRGGLNLSNYAGVMAGGGSGEVVVPGDPSASRLYRLAAHEEEPTMPPKSGRMGDDNLKLLSDWIAGGLLETASSKARQKKKPAFDLALGATPKGRPAEAPPLPVHLLKEPLVRTERAGAIPAVATNPWNSLVAVAGQKQVLLFDLEKNELAGVLAFPEGIAHVLRFSRNGRLLVAGGGKAATLGRVVVWNVEDGERVFAIGKEIDVVLAADLSADQSLVAFSGPGKRLKIYDTADLELLHSIKKHADWVLSLEFSPDGVLLATGDRSGAVHVWEAQTGREFYTLGGHRGGITAISWRADSNVVATASEDGSIKLWEMFKGKQVKSWNAHGGGVQSVHFAGDGRLVSAGRDRRVKVWNQEGKQLAVFEAFPDVALEAAFAFDGKAVVAADWSGDIRVGNAADGKWTGHIAPNPPTVAQHLAEAQARLQQAESELVVTNEALAAAETAAAGPLGRRAEAQSEVDGRQGVLAAADAKLAEADRQAEPARRGHADRVADLEASQQRARELGDAALGAETAHQAGVEGYEKLALGVESKRALVKSLDEAMRRVEKELDRVPDDAQLRSLHEQSTASAQAAKTYFSESRALEVEAAVGVVEQSLAAREARRVAAAHQQVVSGKQAPVRESAARLKAVEEGVAAVRSERDARQGERDAAAGQLAARIEESKDVEAALQAAESQVAQSRSRRDMALRETDRWTAELINIELYAARDQVQESLESHDQRVAATLGSEGRVVAAQQGLGELQSAAAAAPGEVALRQDELQRALEVPRAAEEVVAASRTKLDGKLDFHGVMASAAAEVERQSSAEPENATLIEALQKAREVVALVDGDVSAMREELGRAEATLTESRSLVGAAEARVAEAGAAVVAANEAVEAGQVELEAMQAALAVAKEREAAALAEIGAVRERVERLRRDYLAALPD